MVSQQLSIAKFGVRWESLDGTGVEWLGASSPATYSIVVSCCTAQYLLLVKIYW